VKTDRRDFLELIGMGSAVLVSGPNKGLGYRSVEAKGGTAEYILIEYPVKKG